MTTSHAHDVVPSQLRPEAGFTQARPAQQPEPPTVQVWPVLRQVIPPSGTAQVPLVLPAGRLQTRPWQQSPDPAQAPPVGEHCCCAAQWPVESQMREQHC